MKKLPIILVILAILIIGFVLFWFKNSPAKLDSFATCIKDSGAIFYGAYWCPHCQNQKKMFGRSEKLLPYVECSTPDGQNQLQICKDKNIEGYPAWDFPDGSRLSGELSLETLAEKTSCQLPN